MIKFTLLSFCLHLRNLFNVLEIQSNDFSMVRTHSIESFLKSNDNKKNESTNDLTYTPGQVIPYTSFSEKHFVFFDHLPD